MPGGDSLNPGDYQSASSSMPSRVMGESTHAHKHMSPAATCRPASKRNPPFLPPAHALPCLASPPNQRVASPGFGRATANPTNYRLSCGKAPARTDK